MCGLTEIERQEFHKLKINNLTIIRRSFPIDNKPNKIIIFCFKCWRINPTSAIPKVRCKYCNRRFKDPR